MVDAADWAEYVGIGDLFVVAGQSNASGRATNYQTYSHPTLKAGLFGNDYQWVELADPTDSNNGQVDVVSQESSTPAGTIWPIIADSIMANYNIPVGFIPTAKGATTILQWLPRADRYDRETLFGSMATRADSVGVRAVLWWQGEYDARNKVTAADYNTRLDSIANTIQAELGAKIMPCLLQNSSVLDDADEAVIRTATSTAWGDNVNVLEGPDFSDLTSDDTYHLMTDAKIDSAANRFWRKIRDNIYAP